MGDKTDHKDYSKQKSSTSSCARLEVADFDGAEAHTLFNLPENVFVTRSAILTETGQGSLTMDLSVGGTLVLDDANVAAAGVDESTTGLHLPNGGPVVLTPSAAVTAGTYTVVIEYVEYNVSTGFLTNYT